MEAYYDSDDDVCWGPITLREAKRDLKTGIATKIDRRHSCPGVLRNWNGNMESTSEAGQGESIERARQIFVELDVSEEDGGALSELSFTSELNDNINYHDSYAVITNEKYLGYSKVNSSETEDIFSEKAIENLEEGFSSLDSANSEDDVNRIIMNLSDGLENVEKDSCNGSLYHTNLQSTNNENEVISKITVNLSDSSHKVENDFSHGESYYTNLQSSHSENKGINRRVLNSSDDLDNKESDSDLNNSYNTNLSLMDSKTDLYDKVHVKVEKISIAENCSSVICIESDNSSSSCHQTSLKLDDTLEEIEMALKYGLNYKMPNETETESFTNQSNKKAKDSSNSPILFVKPETTLQTGYSFGNHILKSSDRKTNHSESQIHKEEKILKSPISFTEAKNVWKTSHSLKSHIPGPRKDRKNLNCIENKFDRKDISENTAATIHSNLKIPNSIFKKPCKPLKVTPKKSPNRAIDFKNVVSPVGLYIKNSPAPILKQNITPKTFTSIMTGKSSEVRVLKPIENTEIPEVIYKPAKNQVLHTNTKTALPNSIKKLVQEPTIITKHEKRSNKRICGDLVSKKLLQEELTYLSIDESVLNVTGDTSILSKKQGYIK